MRGEREVGWGFHSKAGENHAEIEALKRAGRLARKATMYVTLEPCCHYGRTPPCVDAIVAAGVRRVVAALPDPNPRVKGGGIDYLSRAGIEVITGVMEDQARRLIEPFSFYIRTGLPFVLLKLAASADGRIATSSGESKWITCPQARMRARQLRAEVDAVMVGAGTVMKDDPRLTVRIRGRRDPARIVVDGKLRVSPAAKVFTGRSRANVIIVADNRVAARKAAPFRSRGVEILAMPGQRGRVSMRRVMRELASKGIVSLLVEGGADLAAQLLRERLVQKLLLFIAPSLIGGDGKPMIASLGVARLSRAPKLTAVQTRRVGDDLLLQGYVKY